MKANHTVRLAMLAFTTLLFAGKEPVVRKNQRGISRRERRKACIGWLVDIEYIGGNFDVDFSM